MAKRKSAWDSLKNILPSGTARHRDVYEGQMLVRGDLPAPETMGSRAIFCAIVGVFVFLLVWCSIAAIQGVSKSVTGSHETNPDPAASWIHVASHYESKTDPSNDKLTLDEFALLRDAYESREDINVHDEPVAPEDPQLDKWIFNLNHYEYKDDPSQTMTTSAYNELKAQYEAELEEYNAQMAEYESYKRSVTNPDELYSLIPAHYRAVDDFSNAITEADYNKLVEEYEKKLSKNKISQDLLEIPVQPVNPEDLYILKQDGEYSWYMNKLDGSTIPVEEYVELVNKYEQDMADYNTAYVEHRRGCRGQESAYQHSCTEFRKGLHIALAGRRHFRRVIWSIKA